MPETKPQVAFIAAVLVLLVMPVVFVVGVVGLVLITHAAPWAGMGGEANRLLLTLSVVWGLLVMSGVLIFVWRLIRQSAMQVGQRANGKGQRLGTQD